MKYFKIPYTISPNKLKTHWRERLYFLLLSLEKSALSRKLLTVYYGALYTGGTQEKSVCLIVWKLSLL